MHFSGCILEQISPMQAALYSMLTKEEVFSQNTATTVCSSFVLV